MGSGRTHVVDDARSKRGAGRPRSTLVDQAIRGAAQELLVEQGYGGMTMEAVAARAGVGKATVYRRWSTKAELLVDSLRGHDAPQVPLPDTGDVRADVKTMLVAIQRSMAGQDGPIMAAFAAEKLRHPELRAVFERVFVTERRRHLEHLVAKAVDQGELPTGTDVELLAETGPAICFHRLFLHDAPPDPELPGRIVDQLFRLTAQAGAGRRRQSRPPIRA
ncbi:MAG: TetR/AcrR family transcriptional regulator [Acidimicrobiales bacterium]